MYIISLDYNNNFILFFSFLSWIWSRFTHQKIEKKKKRKLQIELIEED